MGFVIGDHSQLTLCRGLGGWTMQCLIVAIPCKQYDIRGWIHIFYMPLLESRW